MAQAIWTGTTSSDYSVASNWSPAAVPTTGDSVLIQGSVAITSGLNQSAVAIDEFVVDASYSGTIASITGYLQIDPNSFDFAGTGKAFIDIGSAAISPTVRNTASPSTGQASLYLKGSAIATLTVLKGTVAVAWFPDETSSVTTANCLYLSALATDATLWIGSGVTLTTLNQTGGSVDLRAAATTVTCQGGTMNIRGTGAITTLNNRGGTVYPQSTGTITTLNADDGTTDFTRSLAARTVTTLASTSDGAIVIYDPAWLTVTNKLAPTGPTKITIARA